MKKLSILLISCLTGVSALLTSCDEDHYGPAPVDVTANYSNKLSNANPNLVLTYNGETMIGKSVDFSTVTGETAIVTLYDILPGEKALKIMSIPLSGDTEGYSFSGSGMGNETLSTFNYEGRVVKGKLTLNLSNIKMGNAELWANTYKLSKVERGSKKIIEQDYETDEYIWKIDDNQLIKSACYLYTELELSENGFNTQTWAGMLHGILGYILPQVLQNITLTTDGNIIASYSSDPIAMENILMAAFGLDQSMVDATLVGRTYTSSPSGFAYWYQKDGQLMLKLDLANIITQAVNSNEQYLDKNIINAIINAVTQMDALKLKSLLITLNKSLNNETLGMLLNINDDSFQAVFKWLNEGIPMCITSEDGQTRIYLDQKTLVPLLKMVPELVPLLINILPEDLKDDLGGMIESMLPALSEMFLSAQTFHLGLEFDDTSN